jgi:hypothetical protein
MFYKDFYPTPESVLDRILLGVDINNKVCFDPEGGRGDIVDYLFLQGACKVLSCEINPDLRQILSSKCEVIGEDFLSIESHQISHVQLIVMNPPFAADERHIIHAWEIAPPGCEIVALLNNQTLENRCTKSRVKLWRIVRDNGFSENLGPVFEDADRPTNTEIGMIKLFKPAKNSEQWNEFDGYFDMTEEQFENQTQGIMEYNDLRDVVNRYVEAVRLYDSVLENAVQMNNLTRDFTPYLDLSFSISEKEKPIKRDEFKKGLQKKAWLHIFSKWKMDKYVTTSVREDINRFVEQQTKVPFKMGNIYKMMELLIGTHEGRMNQCLVEAFERICNFSHKNSEAGEGWKTNSDYKVNKKFIHPYITEYRKYGFTSDKVDVSWSSTSIIDDIIKALCYMTGMDYNQVTRFDMFVSKMNMQWGQWYEWGFFRIKGYKKGTMHFEFVDEKVWMEFNRRVAKFKGWQIPQNTDKKYKGTERSKEKTKYPELFVA